MQKIKAFFFFAAAIAVAAFWADGDALATEVTKVNVSKGQVYMDEGKDAGFLKGAEVCFYSFEGKKIACGKVHQTSPARAMVKVTSRLAKQIKKGMEATLKAAAPD